MKNVFEVIIKVMFKAETWHDTGSELATSVQVRAARSDVKCTTKISQLIELKITQ